MHTPHRILGLDPGLQVTGYAVLEATATGPRVAEAGVLRSAEGRSAAELADRIRILYDGLIEVFDQWKPAVLVVEQLYAHYDHPRTAILMAHARGCFFLAGAQRGVRVISYPSTSVKKTITGHGRATKEQVQLAIQRELNLPALPEPPDVADALAVALCHYHAEPGIAQGTPSMTSRRVNLDRLANDE